MSYGHDEEDWLDTRHCDGCGRQVPRSRLCDWLDFELCSSCERAWSEAELAEQS